MDDSSSVDLVKYGTFYNSGSYFWGRFAITPMMIWMGATLVTWAVWG
jgi:hypothetical protein